MPNPPPLRAPRAPWAALLAGLLLVPALLAGDLRMRFVDVGQGDAILVRTPSGDGWLVDGGPRRSAVTDSLEAAMEAEGLTRLEGVVVSHPHLDHFGGLLRLIERVPVGRVLYNIDIDAATWSRFRERLLEKGIPFDQVGPGPLSWDPALEVEVVAARAPSDFALAMGLLQDRSGLPIEVLSELLIRGCGNRELAEELGVDLNDYSIVLRVVYGEFEALLTGDATEHVEERLLESGADVDVDVLKVAHHGSRWSSTLEFLQEATPASAVIQSGEDNSYGHPHREAVRRLQGQQARIRRNDPEGELLLEARSDGTYSITALGR